MGKILALFLIAYFVMYLYRKFRYKKKNSIGQIKYYERELAKKQDFEDSDIIDVESDEDDSQPPKYLH